MRFLLYLLWSLVSFLVIVLVVITVLLTVFQEEVEDRMVYSIERVTGRDIVVEGGFSFRFNPRPTFIANDVKMANASWANRPWMLEVDALQASLSLSKLLKGEVNLYSVEGRNPKVLVEQDVETGKINWHFTSKREPRPFKWLAENLTIEVAAIRDAQVLIEVGDIKHDLALDSIVGETDFFSKLIKIQALGQLDAKPLKLDIQLDNLRNMFLRKPTKTEFNGLHGATKITGRGEIQDLFRWWGHNIKLGLAVPTLKEVQGWVSTSLIETPALQATASFVQPERWASARFDDIVVKSDALDGQTRITGTVRQLRGMNGINLKGELRYPLASLMNWKGLESKTDALVEASVMLSGDKKNALAFDVISASLLGEGVEIHGQGGVEHLLQPTTEGIPFKGTVSSVNKLGLINAKQWFETDALNGGFELKKKNGRLALEGINVSSFEGRATLKGELQDISSAQLGVYELSAKLGLNDIKLLNSLNKSKLPAFKQTDLLASIDMQRSEFSASDVALKLRSTGLLITGEGEIQDLKNLHIDAAKVTMEAKSIADINAQFTTNFPELGNLKATGIINGNTNNAYDINELTTILNNKHQSIFGSGNMLNLGPELTARLGIEAEINSLTNIPTLLESSTEVPDHVKGHGKAKLTAARFDDWSFTDIEIVFDGANKGILGGSVKHFPKAADFALIADFRRLSTTDLPTFEMINTLKPENIRAYMHVDKKPDQENFSVNHIDANFNLASGAATVNIGGAISDMSNFSGLSLLVGLSTSDLHAVPYLSELPLKDNLSGIASLKLHGHPGRLGITLSNVNLANTELHGELILRNEPGLKPVLKGRLGSNSLDLLGLLHQEEHTRLFSAETLELAWLNKIDADIKIKADHFNGEVAQLDNATLNLLVQDGIFNMPDMNGAVGDGNMAIWLTIVAQQKPYHIITSMKAANVKPEHINLFGNSDFIRGGEINIDIGLAGSGTSIADFMGNAYGKIQLELIDSTLKHRNLKLFGADLIAGVFDIITSLSHKTVYFPIECGIIHFPVLKGQAVASQGIAIKTDKVTVLGGGILNLESEELEIIFRPKARKGLGISAGTVANIIKVSGSIDQPKIAVDTASLIKSSATIGAAIVSGGWTLLAQGLLDRNKANSDVCQQTLDKPNATFFRQTEEVFKDVIGER